MVEKFTEETHEKSNTFTPTAIWWTKRVTSSELAISDFWQAHQNQILGFLQILRFLEKHCKEHIFLPSLQRETQIAQRIIKSLRGGMLFYFNFLPFRKGEQQKNWNKFHNREVILQTNEETPFNPVKKHRGQSLLLVNFLIILSFPN
jgi:hypothetical protein